MLILYVFLSEVSPFSFFVEKVEFQLQETIGYLFFGRVLRSLDYILGVTNKASAEGNFVPHSVTICAH